MILKSLKLHTDLGIITNCYIVTEEKTKETMVIDPGGECEKITEMLEVLGIDKIKYIYLTHCHGDHLGATSELKEKKAGEILIHRMEIEGLRNPTINCTNLSQSPKILEADARVEEGDFLHLGNIEFKVIHTPGHTIGGSCLYCEKEGLLFSGDTLFKGTWGRTDLPTSSFQDVIHSITNKLMILPDNTIVYPGHGGITSIREEEPIYLNLQPRKEY